MTFQWMGKYLLSLNMSIPIYEKISQIRAKLNLTRAQFSDEIGVPVNTLKSIEQKGVNPKSDVLEKISRKWPQYADWLLIGTTSLQDEGVSSEEALTRYRIIDSVDARYMNQCIVKPNALRKLIFIQSEGNVSDLAALILVDTNFMYQISSTPNIKSAVWITPGNMNFDSDHGGKQVLSDFRKWVEKTNADLLATVELWCLKGNYFDDVHKQLHIPVMTLSPQENERIIDRFGKWKLGDEY